MSPVTPSILLGMVSALYSQVGKLVRVNVLVLLVVPQTNALPRTVALQGCTACPIAW